MGILLSKINEINCLISHNNKISESTKTIKKDLFIYARKFYARLENNFLTLKILEEVDKRKFIFLILVGITAQSLLRYRIIENLIDIKQSVKGALKANQLFYIGKKKLNEWVSEI